MAVDSAVNKLRKDRLGDFFRTIVEQGHYGGRTQPTGTRQGLYVATPDGRLLSSNNETAVRHVLGLLYQTSRQWKTQFAGVAFKPVDSEVARDPGTRAKFPENGIRLLEVNRDLPRARQKPIDQWRHNLDYAWLTADEAKSFIPADAKVDATVLIGQGIQDRFVRFHLIDQVRGLSNPWRKTDIESSTLQSKIMKMDETKIYLNVNGSVRINQKPSGDLNPFNGRRVTKDRGLDLKITGRLVFNRKSETFERFDILAIGDRWGTDVYNFRHNDIETAPIGFGFSLDNSKTERRREPLYVKRDGYFAKQ